MILFVFYSINAIGTSWFVYERLTVFCFWNHKFSTLAGNFCAVSFKITKKFLPDSFGEFCLLRWLLESVESVVERFKVRLLVVVSDPSGSVKQKRKNNLKIKKNIKNYCYIYNGLKF